MTQARYSAISGQKAAECDYRQGTPGMHRDASNAPEYRHAYDTWQPVNMSATDWAFAEFQAAVCCQKDEDRPIALELRADEVETTGGPQEVPVEHRAYVAACLRHDAQVWRAGQ